MDKFVTYMDKWKYTFCLLLFASCSENRNIFNANEVVFDSFEKEFSLHAQNVNFDSTLQAPINVFYFDDYLLYKHNRGPYFFSIFSLKSNRLVGRFLQHGRGPNEFADLSFFDEYSIQNQERWLYLSAINERRVLKFNLTDYLKSGATNIELLNQHEDLQMNTHVINDSTFLAYMYTNSDNDFRIFYLKYSSTSDTRKEINLTVNKITDYEEFNKLWAAEYIRQDKKKMAMAMLHMNRIHIFDLEEPKNNITLTPKGQGYISLKELAHQDPLQTAIYYNGVKTTQDHIFALFQNRLISDQPEQLKTVEMHVFNWDGFPQYKLHIDEYLSGFCIDQSRKIMYAFDYEENIYIYDLSQIL